MHSYRITTNGLYRTYRTNLNKNNKMLGDSMTTVETSRNFNTYAEDPAAASKAWRLRRSYWRTNDQIDNSNYAVSKFESAYSAMAAIIDGDAGNGDFSLGLDGLLSTIRGITGSAGSSRVALGKELRQTADNMVSMLNTKYGDEFVFAGADGLKVPFEWNEDKTKLLYRGVDVATEQPKDIADFGVTEEMLGDFTVSDLTMSQPVESDYENPEDYTAATEKYSSLQALLREPTVEDEDGSGNPLYTSADDENYIAAHEKYEALQQLKSYAAEYEERSGVSYDEGKENYDKLKSMAEETTYIDVGLGMKERDDRLIPGSAFNSAVSGLRFLGFGKDENLVMVVKELGEIFSASDPDDGAYASPEDEKRADELLDLLHEGVRNAQDQHTQLSADAKYLKTNLEQLKLNKSELDSQIVDTEDMDMAEAITNMNWAQYCYNAALRIGTNLLSQSLIDYMN